MATITVRIDDDVRDALQSKAEDVHQTLSEFVRDRLQDAVFDFRDDKDRRKGRGGDLEPDSLSALDRHTLALLHRILGRVLPEDENDVDGDKEYQLERAKVLERGFTKEYSVEFIGIEPELSPRHCDFVLDVLQMFRITLHSIKELQKQGAMVDENQRKALTFDGFDHNDLLESQMSDYVRFLVEGGKWSEQKDFVLGADYGNSYHQVIPRYSRMLTEYREVKQRRTRSVGLRSYILNEAELHKIAAARVHPSGR
ncbi:YfbU family protein [Arthrobacter glacialis]|uniref:YfbU family protein n=1 Tax=Arthrobacter glacialis TaxID=1664 RepID=UPI0013FD1309|nr:YfbU family protein [Arthrobacter glacialis]